MEAFLNDGRQYAATVVVDILQKHLYVLGGRGKDGDLDSIETSVYVLDKFSCLKNEDNVILINQDGILYLRCGLAYNLCLPEEPG